MPFCTSPSCREFDPGPNAGLSGHRGTVNMSAILCNLRPSMDDTAAHIPTDADAPVETLYAGKWLSLRKRGRWEYAERNNPGGAVIILALTPQDKVLFVEQYRVAIQQKTIEMPAGLVGDLIDQADEGPLLAAQRELEEETGYRCQRIEFIHRGPSSSGMSTEMITFARAWDLQKVGPGGGDESENIVVHEVPRTEAGAWLFARAADGYSIDPKLFAGLWFIEHAGLPA
jgi:ADP-ribose pyrophosphatase